VRWTCLSGFPGSARLKVADRISRRMHRWLSGGFAYEARGQLGGQVVRGFGWGCVGGGVGGRGASGRGRVWLAGCGAFSGVFWAPMGLRGGCGRMFGEAWCWVLACGAVGQSGGDGWARGCVCLPVGVLPGRLAVVVGGWVAGR